MHVTLNVSFQKTSTRVASEINHEKEQLFTQSTYALTVYSCCSNYVYYVRNVVLNIRQSVPLPTPTLEYEVAFNSYCRNQRKTIHYRNQPLSIDNLRITVHYPYCKTAIYKSAHHFQHMPRFLHGKTVNFKLTDTKHFSLFTRRHWLRK